MNVMEIAAAIEKIGCMSIATEENGRLHSRIVSIMGADEDGIYFLTMSVKPFYRQLKNNPQLSLCGIFPHGRKDGKNTAGQPYFAPGYTLRISGEAHEVNPETINKKARKGSEIFSYFIEDQERYPDLRLFCINKGQGEIYDYDFEMELREHKLLRKPFAFGGAEINHLGARIDAKLCIACGECFKACTFKAIVQGEPHVVDVNRCDMCGSCHLVCPQDAISY